MAILVKDPLLTPFNPPPLTPMNSLYLSYYHAKFWASSSKIDRVVAILVHDPPPTPLNPPPLMPLTSLYLSAWSRVTTMQNFGLLAQKLTELWLF